MPLLNILHFPDKRLRLKAKEVTKFDVSLRKFVSDMFETMYEAPGIGLAATQVNVLKRCWLWMYRKIRMNRCV